MDGSAGPVLRCRRGSCISAPRRRACTAQCSHLPRSERPPPGGSSTKRIPQNRARRRRRTATQRTRTTIEQLRVDGALAHTSRGMNVCKSRHVPIGVRGIEDMWSESRGGLREDRATFPSPRRPVGRHADDPIKARLPRGGGRHGGNGGGAPRRSARPHAPFGHCSDAPSPWFARPAAATSTMLL